MREQTDGTRLFCVDRTAHSTNFLVELLRWLR